jgi:hypothetical protein
MTTELLSKYSLFLACMAGPSMQFLHLRMMFLLLSLSPRLHCVVNLNWITSFLPIR